MPWHSSSLESVEFQDCDDYSCGSYTTTSVSKAVFTQNSLTLTQCGEAGEEREFEDKNGAIGKMKVIDCGTIETTLGTEMVKLIISGTEGTATYKGNSCKIPLSDSKAQIEKACTEAYNNGGNYREILFNDWYKCFENNNFPEWFLNSI